MDVKGSRNNLLNPQEKLGFFERAKVNALKKLGK
jgi:hypothetical protein